MCVLVKEMNSINASYPKMCHEVDDSYSYYDLEDENEIAQCRFTWNWELKSGESTVLLVRSPTYRTWTTVAEMIS